MFIAFPKLLKYISIFYKKLLPIKDSTAYTYKDGKYHDKKAAIVQLDIKDSTGYLRRLKKEFKDEIEAHEYVIKMLDEHILNGFEAIPEYLKDFKKSVPPEIRYEFDQAKIIFDCVNKAHCFAEAVHESTKKYNKKPDKEPFYFRIGIAYGYIYEVKEQFLYRGVPFFRASRLEKKASPGGIYIDQYTYENLSKDLQKNYEKIESILTSKDYIKTPYDVYRSKFIKR